VIIVSDSGQQKPHGGGLRYNFCCTESCGCVTGNSAQPGRSRSKTSQATPISIPRLPGWAQVQSCRSRQNESTACILNRVRSSERINAVANCFCTTVGEEQHVARSRQVRFISLRSKRAATAEFVWMGSAAYGLGMDIARAIKVRTLEEAAIQSGKIRSVRRSRR